MRRMFGTKRSIGLTLALLIVASIAVGVVWAASVHYTKGPTCGSSATTATCTGTIAGLGNANVLIDLSFPNATATTICSNKGSKDVPGQNPAVPVDVEGTVSITKIKNGSVSFTVTTEPPENPSSAEAGCPNNNWTARIDTITFGTGTLTVEQPAGTPVLTTTVTVQ
jgi:hypothetical protein